MKNSTKDSVLGILMEISPNRVVGSIILGIVAGLSYCLILPIILISLEQVLVYADDLSNTSIHLGSFEVINPRLAAAYISCCVLVLVLRALSLILLNRVCIDTTIHLRKRIYEKVTNLPIADLERIGPSKILTALTADIPNIIVGVTVFPRLLISFSTLIGLLIYLLILNYHVFIFVIIFIFVGILTYKLPLILGRKHLKRARECIGLLQEGARGLIYGAKELKLSAGKRADFLDTELYENEEGFRFSQNKGSLFVLFAATYGDLFSFFIIGMITYGIYNFYEFTYESLLAAIYVLVFISGPISAILNSLMPLSMAKMSLRATASLMDEMPSDETTKLTVPPSHVITTKVELQGVYYNYPIQNSGENESFGAGPFNLTLQAGTITFIVGGNGSGKTTLGKLISLHYSQSAGQVLFDDEIISSTNVAKSRQSISAIYSDFYLFRRILGISQQDLGGLSDKYLRKLKLDHKVKIKDNHFSSIKLSDGQKKRLALFNSYLEDRSVYIFDEWAADQDPEFKAIFYQELLPELKSLGKIVVVISHDDRYFYIADNIVKLENGKQL